MGNQVNARTAAAEPSGEEVAGGYRIELLGPHRWRLLRDGRAVSLHATASEARAAAKRHRARRRHGRRALAHLIVVLVGAMLLIAVQPFKDIENPAAARARGFVDGLDAAYIAVRAGEAAPTDFALTTHGFQGAVVPLPEAGIGDLGTGGAAVGERSVLAGTFEGECYVARWPNDGPVTTGVLAEDLPCDPGGAMLFTEAFTRSSIATRGAVPIWAEVIPPDTTRARWYLLAVIAAVFLMFDGVVGATVALIRRSRGG